MGNLKALDLFCGGGGACIGMQQAGFDVYGVDIEKHKNYPGHFIRGDIYHLPVDPMDFDFVWASPPCQAFSCANHPNRATGKHVSATNLIPEARKALKHHPYTCIENVEFAPIRPDLVLDGASMMMPVVNSFQVKRKRLFELSFFALAPPKAKRQGEILTVASATNKKQMGLRKAKGLPGVPRLVEKKKIMGIPGRYDMTHREVNESVPPPYSRFIGEQVRAIIERGKR